MRFLVPGCYRSLYSFEARHVILSLPTDKLNFSWEYNNSIYSTLNTIRICMEKILCTRRMPNLIQFIQEYLWKEIKSCSTKGLTERKSNCQMVIDVVETRFQISSPHHHCITRYYIVKKEIAKEGYLASVDFPYSICFFKVPPSIQSLIKRKIRSHIKPIQN